MTQHISTGSKKLLLYFLLDFRVLTGLRLFCPCKCQYSSTCPTKVQVNVLFNRCPYQDQPDSGHSPRHPKVTIYACPQINPKAHSQCLYFEVSEQTITTNRFYTVPNMLHKLRPHYGQQRDFFLNSLLFTLPLD